MSATQYGEQEIEQEIQAKRLTSPRITPRELDDKITAELYHVFPGTTLTVCCLILENGYAVTGQSAAASPENFSAAASPENFDEEIGRKIARADAREKIWPLEGYLLRESLHRQGQLAR